MGSFTDLNNYANETLTYTDLRDPGPRFNLPIDTSTFAYTATSGTFPITRINPISQVTIEVIDIVRPDDADFSMAVDVSSVPGATVVWPTVPTGCVVANPATGVYVIDGIDTVAIWDQIKDPNIVLPNTFNGVFEYIVAFGWNGGSGVELKSYTVGAFVPVAFMPSVFTGTFGRNRIRPSGSNLSSSASLAGTLKQSGLSTPQSFEFRINTTLELNNYFAANYIQTNYFSNIVPEIIDPELGKTWTVLITPSVPSVITSMSTSGSGGTSSFNGTSKVLTITGSYTQVNSHLTSLTIQFSSVKSDLNLVYTATNDIDDVNDTKTQTGICFDVKYLALPTVSSFNYDEDTNYIIQGMPSVVGPEGNYTYTITPSNVNAVETYTTTGSWNASINNTTKVLTLTGTPSELNSLIGAIVIDSGGDFASNFNLTYTLTNSSGDVNSHSNTASINLTHDEMTNINVDRSFAQSVSNLIFATNTPVITDLEEDATYSITLTSANSIGTFRVPVDATANPYTFTGTKADLNTKLSQVVFVPNYEASYDGYRFETHNLTTTLTKVNWGVSATSTVSLIGPKVGWGGSFSTSSIPVVEGVGFNWPGDIRLAGSNDWSTANLIVKWIAPTDAALTFATMPAGCVLTTESITIASINYTAYVITGIDSVADYNTVKTPSVLFPVNSTLGSRKLYLHTSYNDYTGTPVVNTAPNWNISINPSPYWSSYTTSATVSMGSTTAFSAPSIIFDDGGVGTWTVEIRGKVNASVAGLISQFNTSGAGTNSTQTPGDGFFYTYRTFTGTKASVNSQLASLTITYGAEIWEDISTAQLVFTAEWSSRSGQTQSSLTTNLTFIQSVSNLGFNRTYLSNQRNVPFSINTIRLLESYSAYTWSFEFVASSGEFYQPDPFTSNQSQPNSSITLTSTNVYTENEFYSRIDNLEYYPVENSTSNNTVTITLRRNGVIVSTDTIDLTWAGAGSIAQDINVYDDEDNVVDFFPSIEQIKYCKMDYLVVGGGGRFVNTNGELGGGGAGLVSSGTILNPSNYYTMEVGYGATTDNAGGTSILRGGTYPVANIIVSSSGGNKATSNNGGTNALYSGGTGRTLTPLLGGGGAGSSGNGSNASSIESGLGGNGTTSSISGSSVVYARGGTGGATNSAYYNDEAPTSQTPGSGGGIYNGAIVNNGATGRIIIRLSKR